VTLAPREQCIPQATVSTTQFSIPKAKIVEKLGKTPKSIDKIKIGFIIALWGKVGKKGRQEHDK
jgi:hypothetical protein